MSGTDPWATLSHLFFSEQEPVNDTSLLLAHDHDQMNGLDQTETQGPSPAVAPLFDEDEDEESAIKHDASQPNDSTEHSEPKIQLTEGDEKKPKSILKMPSISKKETSTEAKIQGWTKNRAQKNIKLKPEAAAVVAQILQEQSTTTVTSKSTAVEPISESKPNKEKSNQDREPSTIENESIGVAAVNETTVALVQEAERTTPANKPRKRLVAAKSSSKTALIPKRFSPDDTQLPERRLDELENRKRKGRPKTKDKVKALKIDTQYTPEKISDPTESDPKETPMKRHRDELVSMGPPDENIDIPGGWPEGWIRRVYRRQAGASKGREDKYWYPPGHENHKLRSLLEVKRYLNALHASNNDYNYAWKQRKG